jgi:hypothetical protein
MPNPYVEESSRESQNLSSNVSGAADQAKSKMREAGRTLQNKIDENRAPAAERLRNTASALHQRADRLPGGQKVSGLVHSAAEGMEATADYVREHDLQGMVTDVKHCVRKYPGQALLTALVGGFLIGRAFRRRA